VEREAWERVSRVEVENATTLASAHEDVEGLARQTAFLEGELVEARQVREVIEVNSRGLSDIAVNAERWWDESEREHQEQLEELTLLQT
jgi:hypothetical protein